MFIAVKNDRSLAGLNVNRNDLVREQTGFDRGSSTGLTAERKIILIFTGHIVSFCNVFARHTHCAMTKGVL